MLEAVAEEAHQAAMVHVGDDGDLSSEFFFAGLGAPTMHLYALGGDGCAVVEAPTKDLGGGAMTYPVSEVLRY
jgi:hypothetical protein